MRIGRTQEFIGNKHMNKFTHSLTHSQTLNFISSGSLQIYLAVSVCSRRSSSTSRCYATSVDAARRRQWLLYLISITSTTTTTTVGRIPTRRPRRARAAPTTVRTSVRRTVGVEAAVPGTPAAPLPTTAAGGAGKSRRQCSARWQREGPGSRNVSRKTTTTPVRQFNTL